MKTLNQFMGEALELRPTEQINEDVVITEEDIIESIAEVLGDETVTEEEFAQIYNMVVEQLSGEASEEMLDEEELTEEHDIELKPHPTKKTHYIVHKISKGSGIKSDQLKTGETLNDTHVDDLNDMGYKVKIHKD